MKGFPNQVADLRKLANGLAVAAAILERGENPRDDGVFGPELVRAGIAGTGHTPRPVEQYIREQRTKPVGSQSMRTTARGLRELYRALGLIDDAGGRFGLTRLGLRGAESASERDEKLFKAFWRETIESIVVSDGDGTSHPYQMLLRLVARRPGIPRAKCALALVAHDDTTEELDRIVRLADLDEDAIRRRILVSNSNWDNAKKILPSFAEQLGDVIKRGNEFYLSDAPGKAEQQKQANGDREGHNPKVRRPRSSRLVTPDTIGAAGLADRDEPPIPPKLDPKAMAAAIAARADRLKRHNLLVRKIARLMHAGDLYEDPFDILSVQNETGILVEVKTLSGEADDERDRVRDALAQLLYYEAFVTQPFTESAPLKIAAFELKPSAKHIEWLRTQGIVCIWETEKCVACLGADRTKLEPFLSAIEVG